MTKEKIQENQEEIPKDLALTKTQAKQIKILFKKYKTLLKKHYETANFEGPVAMLERRSGSVEFYESQTSNKFTFEHSDGTQRYILLDPASKKRFPYGGKEFSGYWLHEDYATPLPQNPVLTSELMNISIDKALNDMRKWKAQEIVAKGKGIKAILVGVAFIILAATLYSMLADDGPRVITQTVVRNVTPAILGGITWKTKKK